MLHKYFRMLRSENIATFCYLFSLISPIFRLHITYSFAISINFAVGAEAKFHWSHTVQYNQSWACNKRNAASEIKASMTRYNTRETNCPSESKWSFETIFSRNVIELLSLLTVTECC